MDFQNRVGSKFGGGGMASASSAEIDRKERLRRLAMETMDISKDPYFMRNNLGQFECKLCMTLHRSEANYMSHTQGKRHQEGLRRRAAEEMKVHNNINTHSLRIAAQAKKKNIIRIGKPGYRVSKTRDLATGQLGIEFEINYKDADEDIQPRHRFMSAYEQKIERPDKSYQYVVFACDPYENIAFKIPSLPIERDDDKFFTEWNDGEKRFYLKLNFELEK